MIRIIINQNYTTFFLFKTLNLTFFWLCKKIFIETDELIMCMTDNFYSFFTFNKIINIIIKWHYSDTYEVVINNFNTDISIKIVMKAIATHFINRRHFYVPNVIGRTKWWNNGKKEVIFVCNVISGYIKYSKYF